MIDIDYTIGLVLADPAASYWIKDALRSALTRDPVDAVNDAEVLAKILKHKVKNKFTVDELRTGSSRVAELQS